MFCSSLARVAAVTVGSVTVLSFQSIHANHRRTISCNVEPSQQPQPQQPQKKATISTLKNYSSPAFQGTPVAATLLMHQAVKLFDKQFDGLLEMSPVFVLPEDMPAPESYSKGASGDYDEEDDPTAVHKQFSYSESGAFFGGWASECAVKVPVFEKLDDQEEARLGNAGIRKRPVGSLIMKGKCSYGCAVVQLMYMQVQKLDGSVVWEQDVRQKHSEHHGKHSKAARSLQNALAVRNAKSVQGGGNSRQEEEDDEAFTTTKQATSSVFDELGFNSAFHALQQLENEQDTDNVQEPDMDIHETDFSYVVQADLPGVKKGDLPVSIKDGALAVEGLRQYKFEHRRKGVHVVERNTGSFGRSVELADNIIEDEVRNNDDEEEDDGEQMMVLLEDELEDDDEQDDHQKFSHDGQIGSNRVKVVY
ncbi:hypothetical protein HDU78_008826, partial [Chytriomyces hyalinus]